MLTIYIGMLYIMYWIWGNNISMLAHNAQSLWHEVAKNMGKDVKNVTNKNTFSPISVVLS